MPKGQFFEKIEKLKMLHRVLILVGTVGLLAGAYLYLVYNPKKEQIRILENKIAQLDQKIRRAERKKKELKEMEAQEAQVDAQFKKALELLPNEKEIPSLLRDITQLGMDSKLEFQLFRPQKEDEKGFYVAIPVSIQVTGKYHDVGIFFDRVGAMSRIVNIVDVSMKPVEALSTMLNTSCNAVTYRFRDDSGDEQPPKTSGRRRRR